MAANDNPRWVRFLANAHGARYEPMGLQELTSNAPKSATGPAGSRTLTADATQLGTSVGTARGLRRTVLGRSESHAAARHAGVFFFSISPTGASRSGHASDHVFGPPEGSVLACNRTESSQSNGGRSAATGASRYFSSPSRRFTPSIPEFGVIRSKVRGGSGRRKTLVVKDIREVRAGEPYRALIPRESLPRCTGSLRDDSRS